uniref:uncharacterized protein LOC122594938 n=1 Tax=Erigeron canadensis TaxID=72917 RepID=UPI001CB8A798|nr:uncharacterized protein LOC122594938 [Erigeron canadensis]
MKYKKGSIVEVLTTNELPYHSWRCAKIVSRNRQDYTVRYNVYPGFTNQEIVECVSTKFLRPCPPIVEFSECRPGDVVEVFHELSWKMAVVSKAFSEDLFLVRFVGSVIEFEATKSEIRVRQSWQNDEWVVIGKVQILSKDGQSNKLAEAKGAVKGDSYMKSIQFGAKNENLQESHIVSARTLKRGSPYCLSQDEVNEGTGQKVKITQREGKRLRVLIKSPEKVNVPNSIEMPSEDCIYTYFHNRAAPLYAADVEREYLSGGYRKRNDDDDDTVTCSVGSCSINSYSGYDIEDHESHDSDAESFCQEGYLDFSLCNKEVAAKIHRLELQAYRSTIEALHASGPLTWEKETMVTNLRMSLNISNDEHLIELKNLISSSSTMRIR